MRKIFTRQHKYNECGLGVVEVVIAAAIAVMVLLGVFAAGRLGVLARRTASLERRAALVAEEGLEAARFVRDESWAGFDALPVDTTLYVVFNAGAGTVDLSTTDPGPVDGLFTREVTLDEVFRDGSGNIVPEGTPGATVDDDAREVVEFVSYEDAFGNTRTITLTTYVLKLFDN